MLKWIGRIFLLGVFVIFATGIFAYFDLKTKAPPSIETTRYAVQAYYYDEKASAKIPTRYYYAEKIELEGGYALLTNYWTYDGKRYKNHSGEKRVPPPYDIIRRSN